MNKYNRLVILSFVSVIITGFTTKTTPYDEITSVPNSHVFVVEKQHISSFCDTDSKNIFETRDCTVRIKTDDMDIELTLHDVSWWDCTKLKLKALWEFGF